MAFYLGKHGQDDLVLFCSSKIPTKESHSHLYTAVIGPFKTKVGAGYFARYGLNNPHIRTADDAERLARADFRMEQAIVEESMTEEERTIARECAAQDQYEDNSINPILPNRQTTIQGEILCLTGLKTN